MNGLPGMRTWITMILVVVHASVAASCSAEEKERSLVVTATAYNSVPKQTSGDPFEAAWGDRLEPGMKCIAVSRDLLDRGLTRGVKVRIEGLEGEYVVLDKMAKKWTKRIDLYMGLDVEAAKQWGVRKVRITWTPEEEAERTSRADPTSSSPAQAGLRPDEEPSLDEIRARIAAMRAREAERARWWNERQAELQRERELATAKRGPIERTPPGEAEQDAGRRLTSPVVRLPDGRLAALVVVELAGEAPQVVAIVLDAATIRSL
jgi:3D (Asp-Asp-Asp) domain-containing protein